MFPKKSDKILNHVEKTSEVRTKNRTVNLAWRIQFRLDKSSEHGAEWEQYDLVV